MSGKERPKVTKKRVDQKITRNHDKISNKMAINTYLSIITLNVNALNVPVKIYKCHNG